jgi:hypothetical protein
MLWLDVLGISLGLAGVVVIAVLSLLFLNDQPASLRPVESGETQSQ